MHIMMTAVCALGAATAFAGATVELKNAPPGDA